MKNYFLLTAAFAFLFLGALTSSAADKSTQGLPLPLTLEGALDFALLHNPQLALTKAQLREQKGILVQSISGGLPNISAEASGNEVEKADQLTYGLGGPAAAAGVKVWSADVTLRQTLFAGGGVATGILASRETVEAAKSRVVSQIETTVLAVKQDFYAVLVDREIIAVHEESLQVLEEQMKNVKAKHDVGVASDFELLQAQVAVANERPMLIRARNDYRVAAESLLADLGTLPQTDLNPDDVKGTLVAENMTVELQDLLDSAERHRADIRAVAKDTAAARTSVWKARAGYLPNVQAFAGYDWAKNEGYTQLNKSVDGWNVGLTASVPLFDGFSNASKVYQAKARRREAEAIELQTRLGVSVEVRQAHSGFTEAKEILESSRQVVDQARESQREAKARYNAGSSTQLDVLQAQSALSQAQLTYFQAQYDYIVAIAKLEKATGSHEWKINVVDKTKPANPERVAK